jgi:DNA-binding transcriptional LysR family regulator
MRLRHIEVFHSVYTCGSVTAAARQLGVSQPSISKVLSHAEQQLGYRLFDRVRGKIVPTREAERLIGLVSVVYQGIEEVQRVAGNLAGYDQNRIRIAMTPSFGIRLVPGAIEHYLRDHPEIRFEVETLHYHQIVRALNQSRIDIGVVFHPQPMVDIASVPMADARFVVVAHESHGFGEQRRVRLEALEGLPFIGLSLRGPLGQLLHEQVASLEERFEPLIVVETYQMAMALVKQGAGFAIVDEITARSVGSESVSIMQLEPPISFDIALLHSANSELAKPATRFVGFLREQLGAFLQSDIHGHA